MNSYLVSSTKKSSGKTTLTIGLTGIASNLNQNVAVFKKGPDYIDPLWLKQASKNFCYNLDFFTMSDREILKLFKEKTVNANVSLTEGNKGLFDGLSISGKDSNAQLAKLLNLSVILIIDCIGTTRGIAPLLQGYKNFDKKIKYFGVVLNNIANDRHENKIINSIKEYTDFEIIGSIHKNKELNIIERHLGLEPTFQNNKSIEIINKITKIIKNSVDIKKIFKPNPKKKLRGSISKVYTNKKKFRSIRIGVALDNAFGFYYPDDIEKIRNYGVSIKFFNTLTDKKLPNVDGLFIGGGFPETVANKISRNRLLMKEIYNFIEDGKPVYAECGGLMYLCKNITYNKASYPMVGIIDAKINMFSKPVGRGYVVLNCSDKHPWPISKNNINAHEFHYSDIKFFKKKYKYAYNVKRGHGVNGKSDGILYKNLVATYSHMRDTRQSLWIENFLSFIDKYKRNE